MNTKSNILKQIELIECRNRVKNFINRLFETYDIDDIVIGFVNNEPNEIVDGYITDMKLYDSIDECINNYNVTTDCIRIFENKYYVGKYTDDFNNCVNNSMRINNFVEF